MSEKKTHRPTVPFGVVFAGIGLYFVLVGFGVLPIPGGEKNLHAPLWVVSCAGLAFLLGGIAVVVGALGGANEKGVLPKTAPAWMPAAQRLCVFAIFVVLAAAITWVAFGPGERRFSGSLPLTGSANEFVGRAAFGFGAAMMWLAVLVMLSSWRRKPGRGSKS